MNADPNPAKAIFLEAVEQHAPDEWPIFLGRACASQPELRGQVEALLKAHREIGTVAQDFGEASDPSLAPTLDQQSLRERGGAVVGPYKLIKQIGEGGMGTVWMAEQIEPVKRVVALKLIKVGMDSKQVIARFEAERQALALMDHTNIARVLDAGQTPAGRPYFVMELVNGVPITRYCDEHHLTPRQRLELFIPVCQAVQHAHQKGIIHRDIKPSNVLVALCDGNRVPKVIDFGVAKATGQSLTEKTLITGLGAIVGTLEYMSPEQAEVNQLDIDTRSDIYSLGVLLYELLTGSPPFARKDLEKAGMLEMLRVIREQEPSKPSTKLSTAQGLPTLAANRGTEPAKLKKLVRGELDWIVMKALEKDRNRRYETANGFALDVQRYLADEAVQACPPSVGYRFRKFAWRNKARLAVAGLVLALLLLLGGGIGWIVSDRASRQAALENEVNAALDDVQTSYLLDKLPDALAALKRAEGLLAGGNVGKDLRQGIHRWHDELGMADRLEEIRLEHSMLKDDGYDVPGARIANLKAFRRYGLDMEAEPWNLEEMAERIRLSAIKNHLVAGLDEWSMIELPPLKDRLLTLARRADPDPWRDRLRQAVAIKDLKSLTEIAKDKQAVAQPRATILLLEGALYGSDQWPLAIDILRQAQRQHPSDFWINTKLGDRLMGLQLAPSSEAVGYYRAALAIRPDSLPTRISLAYTLKHLGLLAHAEAELRDVIHRKPDFAPAHHGLADMFAGQGRLEESVAAYRALLRLWPDYPQGLRDLGDVLNKLPGAKAEEEARQTVAAAPDSFMAQCVLGETLYRHGKAAEAEAAFQKAIRLMPNNARLWESIGRTYARLGRWSEAASAMSRSLEQLPRIDERWYLAAGLYVAAGDFEGYRKVCAKLLKKSEESSDPQFAERTAKVCTLAPGAVPDYDRVVRLADRAVTGTEKNRYYRFFVLAKGLTEYRAGRYAEAITWLERFAPKTTGLHWDASTFAVLAMAKQRMGEPDKAQATLAWARKILKERMPAPAKGALFEAGNWHDWLHSQIFLREAEGLLGAAEPSDVKEKEK